MQTLIDFISVKQKWKFLRNKILKENLFLKKGLFYK